MPIAESRAERIMVTPDATLTTLPEQPKKSAKARAASYRELRVMGGWDALRGALAHYLSETVSDPLAAEGDLWVCEAFPSTGNTRDTRRVLTLVVGGEEVCGITAGILADGTRAYGARFTVDRAALAAQEYADADGAVAYFAQAGIDVAEGLPFKDGDVLSTLEFWGPGWDDLVEAFAAVVEVPQLVEAAYARNRALMVAGNRKYLRFHNQLLGRDIVHTAIAASSEK